MKNSKLTIFEPTHDISYYGIKINADIPNDDILIKDLLRTGEIIEKEIGDKANFVVHEYINRNTMLTCQLLKGHVSYAMYDENEDTLRTTLTDKDINANNYATILKNIRKYAKKTAEELLKGNKIWHDHSLYIQWKNLNNKRTKELNR